MADRRLQVFHAVAKHLSFTKAAEALFMTQPAVTFQIRQLEQQFNTRLFDRVQGRVTLTAAGATALEYAERILALSGELDQRMQAQSGQLAGPLLVGASMTVADYILPRVLGAFKARFPAVAPRLVVGNSDLVQSRVAERSLDLGFIEGDSRSGALAVEVLCDDELRLTCASAHALARQASVTPQELAALALVGREPGSGTREVIDHYLEAHGVAPDAVQRVMELGSPEAIKGLVATGLGCAVMSRATVVNELRLGTLVQVPLAPPLVRQLCIVYPKERIHSALVSAFVQFAKEQVRTQWAAPEAARQPAPQAATRPA